MPIRHGNTYRALGWLAAAALCANLYVGEALGQVENDVPGESPESPAEAAEKQENPPAPPVIPPEPAEPVARPKIYQPNCDSPDSREEADLCAQRSMAEAAEDTIKWVRMSVEWAERQYYATIGEMVALVATILVAIVAVCVAFTANRIARESAERQLRAWVYVQDFDITKLSIVGLDTGYEDEKGHELWINFKLEAHNSGIAPAYDVAFKSWTYNSDNMEAIEAEIAKTVRQKAAIGMTGGFVVPPNDKITWEHTNVLGFDKPPAGTRGGVEVWMAIMIRYRITTDNETHITVQHFFIGSDTGHATQAAMDFQKIMDGSQKIRISSMPSSEIT